jgi:hypothetical protein
VGDTTSHDAEDGGQVWVVTGTNGENMIRADGATCSEAWRRAIDQGPDTPVEDLQKRSHLEPGSSHHLDPDLGQGQPPRAFSIWRTQRSAS